MQLEAHPDCRGHHLLQEVQVSKNPLVLRGDAEVTFEEGVEAIQEGLKTSGWWGGERKNVIVVEI